MQRTRVLLMGALALTVAGCGNAVDPLAAQSVSPRAASELRSSCPGWTDSEIVDSLVVIDDAWWNGASHQLSYDVNLAHCDFQTSTQPGFVICLSCWDAMVDYIYLDWH